MERLCARSWATIAWLDDSSGGKLTEERSIPDQVAGLQILYREQERRKRVLGWRRTHKDPFECFLITMLCASGPFYPVVLIYQHPRPVSPLLFIGAGQLAR